MELCVSRTRLGKGNLALPRVWIYPKLFWWIHQGPLAVICPHGQPLSTCTSPWAFREPPWGVSPHFMDGEAEVQQGGSVLPEVSQLEKGQFGIASQVCLRPKPAFIHNSKVRKGLLMRLGHALDGRPDMNWT